MSVVRAGAEGARLSCLACGTMMRLAFHYMGYEYHRCPRCGHVTTHPLPDSQTIEAHYTEKFRAGNYQLLREFSTAYLAYTISISGCWQLIWPGEGSHCTAFGFLTLVASQGIS